MSSHSGPQRSIFGFDFEVQSSEYDWEMGGIGFNSVQTRCGDLEFGISVSLSWQHGVTAWVTSGMVRVPTQRPNSETKLPPLELAQVKITAMNHWGSAYSATWQGSVHSKPFLVLPDSCSKEALAQGGWLAKDGMLRFRLEVLEEQDGATSLTPESNLLVGTPENPASLLTKMWTSPEHTDFFIVSRDCKEIHCHRAVLSAASPVFKGMLASSCQEGVQKFAAAEANATEIAAMLQYVYSEHLAFDIDCTTLLCVLQLADYYQIPTLLDVCAGRLGPMLTEHNIVQVLECVAGLQQGSPKNASIMNSVKEHVRTNPELLSVVCANAREPQALAQTPATHAEMPIVQAREAMPAQPNHAEAESAQDDASSLISVGTQLTNCFMPDCVFTTLSGQCIHYLPASQLQKGSRVMADDGKTVVEVIKTPEVHKSDKVVELCAGDTMLCVTPDHRIPVPQGNGGGQRDVQAAELKLGDMVFVNGVATELSSIKQVQLPDKIEVLKIAFSPDLPVGAFTCPLTISSKGSKKKSARRGGMNKRTQSETGSNKGSSKSVQGFAAEEYKTIGEYQD